MRLSEPRAQLYKVDTFPPLLQKRSLQPNRGSAGAGIEPSSARCTASCELRRHRCTSLERSERGSGSSKSLPTSASSPSPPACTYPDEVRFR